MKKYNITVNGTTYEVVVEEAGEVSAAPVYSAPAAPSGYGAAPMSDQYAELSDDDGELPF